MRADSQDIILYGAGGHVERWLDAIEETSMNVCELIDRYTTKTSVRGLAVRRPDDDIDKSLPVYVSVSNISTAVARELRYSGHTTVYDFNESVTRIPSLIEKFLPTIPWYVDAPDALLDEGELVALERSLADPESVTVLRELCAFRRHLDAAHYLRNDGQLQYFPDDVPWFDAIDDMRFVDCGAFTGDTLDVLVDVCRSRGLALRSVSLIEPEAHNLIALNRTVARHVTPDCPMVVLPCGAWSHSAIMDVTNEGGSSALVEREVDSASDAPRSARGTIAAVPLDHAVYGMRPNFIKMDIEGAEREALAGAQALIRDFHPVLAICVYHLADDVWEIPKRIRAIRPDYDFYLRSHGDTGLETVLYAVPARSGRG